MDQQPFPQDTPEPFVIVTCPRCQRDLQITSVADGQTFQCPLCSTLLTCSRSTPDYTTPSLGIRQVETPRNKKRRKSSQPTFVAIGLFSVTGVVALLGIAIITMGMSEQPTASKTNQSQRDSPQPSLLPDRSHSAVKPPTLDQSAKPLTKAIYPVASLSAQDRKELTNKQYLAEAVAALKQYQSRSNADTFMVSQTARELGVIALRFEDHSLFAELRDLSIEGHEDARAAKSEFLFAAVSDLADRGRIDDAQALRKEANGFYRVQCSLAVYAALARAHRIKEASDLLDDITEAEVLALSRWEMKLAIQRILSKKVEAEPVQAVLNQARKLRSVHTRLEIDQALNSGIIELARFGQLEKAQEIISDCDNADRGWMAIARARLAMRDFAAAHEAVMQIKDDRDRLEVFGELSCERLREGTAARSVERDSITAQIRRIVEDPKNNDRKDVIYGRAAIAFARCGMFTDAEATIPKINGPIKEQIRFKAYAALGAGYEAYGRAKDAQRCFSQAEEQYRSVGDTSAYLLREAAAEWSKQGRSGALSAIAWARQHEGLAKAQCLAGILKILTDVEPSDR